MISSSSSSIAHAFLLCIILLSASLFPMLAAGSSGFSVELIHRDSPKSPLYDPTSTPSLRLRAAAERSRARANFFRDAIHKSVSSEDNNNNFYSEIIPNTYEYLMSFYLGTPEKKILAIADTGSDLIWVQCSPCDECYPQTAPLFDPQASSSYKSVSCNANTCSALPQSSCGSNSECHYHYAYGDMSFVEGFMSTETVGFDSAGGRQVHIPSILFGCTHRSNGTFDKNDAGLVGLGGGKLSLIRQLGSTIGSKFSYCLPSSDQTSATSKLNFGSNAVISSSNAVTIPLISGSPDTFYFLSLEHISVAGKAVDMKLARTNGTSAEAQGNIIIDSGTTLTLIDDITLQSVENIAKSSVSLPQVADPSGVFSLCFNVSDIGANGTTAQFPEIAFQFSGASVVLPQSNAFVVSTLNTVCLAMVSSGSTGDDISIFGNIAQQNFHIGYDLSAMQLTFAPTDCSNLS